MVQAATVRTTVDVVRSAAGPPQEHYVSILQLGGALFKYVVGSLLTDDGYTTILPTGGMPGAWIRQRENDQGANLGDADATVDVTGGAWRVLPAATLTANRLLTLGTTNAAVGDRIELTRLDVGAFTVTIANGGPAAGTLATMPVSVRSHFAAFFNGANWLHRSSGLLL